MVAGSRKTIPNISAGVCAAGNDGGRVAGDGAYIAGVATIVFLYTAYDAFARKRVAGDNPWGVGATTLEWTLPSPPPFHTFETQPVIK